jgi:hypothetical protein
MAAGAPGLFNRSVGKETIRINWEHLGLSAGRSFGIYGSRMIWAFFPMASRHRLLGKPWS